MNFTVSQPRSVRADAVTLGSVAASAGFGLGLSQRFLVASLEIDPSADLAELAARLDRIEAPHVLVIPGAEGLAVAAIPAADSAGLLLAAMARTVAGLQEQAGMPIKDSARVLVQEPPAGISSETRIYRRLVLPSLLPAAAAEALAWVAGLVNAWAAAPAPEAIPEQLFVRLQALEESLARQAPAGTNMRHLIHAAHRREIPT